MDNIALIKINNGYYRLDKIVMVELTKGETIYTFSNTAPKLELNPRSLNRDEDGNIIQTQTEEEFIIDSVRKLKVLADEGIFLVVNSYTLINPDYITNILVKEEMDDEENTYTRITYELLNAKFGVSSVIHNLTLDEVDNSLDNLIRGSRLKILY